MQTARVAVPALFAIAVVAAIVIVSPPAPPLSDAPVRAEATPYSADHARIPATAEAAEPAPTF